MLEKAPDSVNSIAILTGISDVFALDVDKNSKVSKEGIEIRSGLQLLKQLTLRYGEPVTLKAKSARGGLHYLFKSSLSTKFQHRDTNFATLKYDGQQWAIDGRGGMGLLFVEPSSYMDESGTVYSYKWDRSCCNVPQAMPDWLIEISKGDPDERFGTLDPSLTQSQSSAFSATQTTNDNTVSNDSITFPGLQSAVEKIFKLLKEKLPADKSRFCGMDGTTPYDWHILKYKTVGTRTCLNGEKHTSNNWSVLSNGALLLY